MALFSSLASSASSSSSSSLRVVERVFRLADGIQVAAQVYGNASAQKHTIVMLHGWLDNCRTFWKLAPALAKSVDDDDVQIVAIDFPGHGKSSHKSPDGTPSVLVEGVYYLAEVLKELEWNDNVSIVGHSMGAGIGLSYAAAFPDQIGKLVLLEGIGPLPRKEEEVHNLLRAHIDQRIAGNRKLYAGDGDGGYETPPRKRHSSLEAAVRARVQTATNAPGGNQWISAEAAQQLVERAVTSKNDDDEGGGGVRFQHDPRLLWPSLQYLTWNQVQTLQKSIKAPTCLLVADNGWPFFYAEQSFENLRPSHFARLPGSHHFHADPDTCDAVVREVEKFLFDDKESMEE